MTRTFLLISVLLFGCKNDSISFLEYYYPVEAMSAPKVYEYHASDVHGNNLSESNLFFKVYPLNNNQWSLVGVDWRLNSTDSAVIKQSDEELLVETMFTIVDGKYYQCEEIDQIFYPSDLQLSSQTKKSFTYKDIANHHFDQVYITHSSQILNADEQNLTFKVESKYSELDNSGDVLLDMKSTMTNRYEKGIGLSSFVSESEGIEITFNLIRVWEIEEWKKRTVATKSY